METKQTYTLLGGGLSAISLAYYLQENEKISEIHILEKDDTPGGICRTYAKDGIEYDVGPHIIFSKDKEILWMCRECGYVYKGKSAPKKCPNCHHPQGYFQVLCENY